jgi:methylated-DNA-[protein]-cysteine S-methyltransferase
VLIGKRRLKKAESQKTKMLYTAKIQTLISELPEIRAVASDKGLRNIIFSNQADFDKNDNQIRKDDLDIFIALKSQLDLYAKGLIQNFALPLEIVGSDYQRKIWGLLQKIPYGSTASYKDIADKIDEHHRPVGAANGKNPLPIIIPCHRVINTDGTIGGYANTKTQSTHLKIALLKLEGVFFNQKGSKYAIRQQRTFESCGF